MPIAAEPQSTASVYPLITPRLKRYEEARYVLSFVQGSLEFFRPQRQIMREVEDSWYVRTPYMSTRDAIPRIGGSAASFPAPRRSGARLKDPETHQIIESLADQGLGVVFPEGGGKFIDALPIGEDDPAKARLLSRLLEAAFTQPGMKGTFWRGFKESFAFGLVLMEIGWQARTRWQLTSVPIFDDLGQQLGTRLEPREVNYINNLLLGIIDKYDAYPDPRGTRLHVNMKKFAKRFRISERDAMRAANAGLYDLEATRQAIQVARRDTQSVDRPVQEDFQDSIAVDLRPSGTKLLTGIEFFGEADIDYEDDHQNRVITLLEGEVVRSHIIPFIDGRIPIASLTMNPVASRFYGLSPAEVVRYLQDSADNMLMVLNDAADLMVKPVLLVGAGFGGDVNRLRRREFNDVIPVGDPEKVKELLTNNNALTIAASEYVRRKQAMREASGATDPMQAISSNDRKTAFEVNTLMTLASKRVMSSMSVIEEDELPIIGQMFHARFKQFLPDEGAVAVLNGEPLRVRLEDIDIDADIRFVGSSQAISLAQKAQNYEKFFTTIGSNMDLLLVAPEPFVEYARDVLRFPNAEKMILGIAQRVSQLRQAQAAGTVATGKQSGSPPATGPAKEGA